MDQKRDTIGDTSGSPNRPVWPKIVPASDTPPQAAGNETVYQSDANNHPSDATKGAIRRRRVKSNAGVQVEHPVGAESKRQSTPELPPTLFELPDRTPRTESKQQNAAHFELHRSHSGPPASHVDPPSGNHSHLAPPKPNTPDGSDWSPTDPMPASSQNDRSIDVSDADASNQPFHTTPDDRKIAAHSESPLSWADAAKLTWVKRSAVIMVMLMMVTLAFFSGRGFDRPGQTESNSELAEVEIQDLSDTVVMINEQDTALSIPSYIADAPDLTSDLDGSTIGTSALGAPITADSTAMYAASEPDATDHSPLDAGAYPSDFSPTNSMVAYRSNETSTTEAPSEPGTNAELPAGINERLKLEDDLRYSETPHALGDLLQILHERTPPAAQ